MKNFGLIIAVIVIGFIGSIVYLSSHNQAPTIEITATQQEILTIDKDDHVFGNKDSQVVLFEYFDFECPACGAYHPLIKEVLATHGDTFAYVPRNFPLHFHPNGRNAALAVESAGLQGKYEEMVDVIFNAQADWGGKPGDAELFTVYAQEVGLNIEEWKKEMDSPDIQLIVDTDVAEGRELGVAGTPTFFLNGEKIDNPRSAEALGVLIDEINETGVATTTATTTE